MPTNTADADAIIARLVLVLGVGEVMAESIRTHLADTGRRRLLGLPAPESLSSEVLLGDVADHWRDAADDFEHDLNALGAALRAADLTKRLT